MVDFQLAIAGPAAERTLDEAGEGSDRRSERFAVEQHSRGAGRALDRIDDLGDIWDTVVEKLTTLAAQSQTAASRSPFELSSIEFSIGIEAGLNVGLVTKGEASVSLTFSRRAAVPGKA